MREPLPGWIDISHSHSVLGHLIEVTPSPYAPSEANVGIRPTGGATVRFLAPNVNAAKIAAEAAARAMVADMAAALGGSVTWATEGGSE